MSPRKFVLDGDYGIDDALAALYLAAEPDVEILAVGSVHGNAEAGVAATNALTVLDLVGLDHVPVAVGAAVPMAQPVAISAHVHGGDGLGGRAPTRPAGARRPSARPAATQLIEVLRAHPGECTILATGPLTNLALALLLDPDVAGLAERVVVMGGTVWAPGNIGSHTEANMAHDPEAAELVLGGSWPVTLVGLDVTLSTWLGEAELARLEAATSERARFVWSILQHYVEYYTRVYGRKGCAIHDPAAARLAVDPGLGRSVDVPVSVELRSEQTRGMLLVDRREFAPAGSRPPVRIVTDVDRHRLVDRLVAGLIGPLPA